MLLVTRRLPSLIITAGDNSDRFRSESSFAALCGLSPVQASSGKVTRHRLNRGDDRSANSALHINAIGRIRTDTRTQAYVSRRIAEGHSRFEVIRFLKRYIVPSVQHNPEAQSHHQPERDIHLTFRRE